MTTLPPCSCLGCLALIFVLALNAQQAGSDKTKRKQFSSPDSTFRFAYSEALVSCTKDSKQASGWAPADSCGAYAPVCSNFDSDFSGTVACIAYPAREMKDTNFEGAAFSVSELKAATHSECLKFAPPSDGGNPYDENVNGVTYRVAKYEEGAAGHLLDGEVYRTFRNHTCYELDIRVASSNIGNYDPGTVKPFDSEKVQQTLKAVLPSFQFLK